jgi:chemotaxis protein MotB
MRVRTTPPAARAPHSLRASGDRWLFGYADVVTLLFASFAALYTTQIDSAASPPALPASAAPARPTGRTALEARLSAIVSGGRGPAAELTPRPGSLVLSVAEAGSFPPGQADLTRDAQVLLEEIASAVRSTDSDVRVEGHTDDQPIRTAAFASNWELSTARATRVVSFLIQAGIRPARLSATGFAEHRPRVPNRSAGERARNRRVDLVILERSTASEDRR